MRSTCLVRVIDLGALDPSLKLIQGIKIKEGVKYLGERLFSLSSLIYSKI